MPVQSHRTGRMNFDQALIVSEAYAGLQAQALGLAERALLPTELRPLTPRSAWRHLPARFWPHPLGTAGFGPIPEHDLIIGCGGVAGAVGAALRKKGLRVVQVQNPRIDPRRFDLVVANFHDELTGPNVLVTRTALHRVTPQKLKEAKAIWAPRLLHLRRPLVEVLVGGANGRFRFGEGEALELAMKLATMMSQDKVGMVITPSRRTGTAQIAILKRILQPMGAYIWDMTGENPYFGFLGCADAIVVTMDSISMVSEAIATKVPVLVQNLPGKSRRIGLFAEMLDRERRVRPFLAKLETWAVQPIDDTDWAAAEMRRRLEITN